MTASVLLVALTASWALGGMLLGATYFAKLRRTAELFCAGEDRVLPITMTLSRLGGAIVFFAVAVQFGALPLLGAFIGFLVARGFALRAVQRAD